MPENDVADLCWWCLPWSIDEPSHSLGREKVRHSSRSSQTAASFCPTRMCHLFMYTAFSMEHNSLDVSWLSPIMHPCVCTRRSPCTEKNLVKREIPGFSGRSSRFSRNKQIAQICHLPSRGARPNMRGGQIYLPKPASQKSADPPIICTFDSNLTKYL